MADEWLAMVQEKPAVTTTELEVIRELARCLRLIREGWVPHQTVRSVVEATVLSRQGRCP